MNLSERIAITPGVLGGKPVIAGTRISVEMILRKLAAGMTTEEVLQDLPRLKPEDVRAALEYATATVAEEDVVLTGTAS